MSRRQEPGHQLCRCDLDARVTSYGALADVFAGSSDEVRSAVGMLRGAESWCSLRFFDDEEMAGLAAEAVAASRDPRALAEHMAERRRLIGDEAFDPFVNTVSPCAATYLASDPELLLAELEGIYREARYVPRFSVPCVSHIALELDFMRFVLECVRARDEHAAELAARFFCEHLSGWGVLFAVAYADAAKTAIGRYAAAMLDRWLSCEHRLTRHSMPARCIQRRLAAPE